MPEPSLRARALKFLARREFSRKELKARLAPHATSDDELESLLDDLAARGQLSDERYAESRVHALSRKYGSARIVQELKARGVAPEIAEQAAHAARASDLERARAALLRKYGQPPATREERARCMRFLQSRGFSFDVIRAALDVEEESE